MIEFYLDVVQACGVRNMATMIIDTIYFRYYQFLGNGHIYGYFHMHVAILLYYKQTNKQTTTY